MSSRLDGIPVYQQQPATLAAADFNRVQLAFKRLGKTVHITLTGLRSLQLILENDAWVVADGALNNVPVLAWTDFQIDDRVDLHLPVRCVLKMYHAHGQVILDQVMARMETELQERLDKLKANDAGARVVKLSRD